MSKEEDRMRTALQNVVNALGPEKICFCEECNQAEGLQEEASWALHSARWGLGLEEYPNPYEGGEYVNNI